MSAEPRNMRLAEPFGLYLDRAKELNFRFDGKTYRAFGGDTIASALSANGVRTLSRSFKYHRPRGILSMGGQDGNTLVQVADEPGVRADTQPVERGMEVEAQNVFGSLKNDYAGVIGYLGRFLPVGFYYKAFYKPKGAWRYWEKLIRRMAGLGRVDVLSRCDDTDKQYRFADVTVIGAGPAGRSAALKAGESGAEVLLIDETPVLGGSLNYARYRSDRKEVDALRDRLVSEVEQHPNIEIMSGAQCSGWFDDNWLSILTKRRLTKLRSTSVVLASGSFEQPAVFRNNDLPGVMLGSAAQRLIRLFAVKPGRQAVVLTANPDGYGVALDLLDAGVDVAAVIDLREARTGTDLEQRVMAKNLDVRSASMIHEAIPGPGKHGISGVNIATIARAGKATFQTQFIACDLLCVSAGYSPAAQLLCHTGGRLVYDEETAMLNIKLPQGNAQRDRVAVAGSVNGVFDLDRVLSDGRYAGWQAAVAAGFSSAEEPVPPGEDKTPSPNHAWPIFPHKNGKEFVDFDEDLHIGDIERSVAEGYDDLELVKRYSTVVMGPSQGRQSALNNLRIATRAAGKTLQGFSITTQRPPFQPEPVHLLAGRPLQPRRRTPMHHRHLELGAQMIPAGSWQRPAWYGSPAERTQHLERETLAIRQGVGLIDVSTLGKLEIRGPDAAEFVNRMYTFAYLEQPLNRLRYVLMTDETGVVTDDGVAARLSEEHFYVSTTSAGSEVVYRSMLKWNAQWCLDVDVTNVTGAYAAISIAGPDSRRVLAELSHDLDFSAEAFAYSEVREGHVCNMPVRLLRVGFVGELGWEIHVPSSQGEYLWDRLMEAGKEYGIRAVGVEAQRVLRLEKGHIIVGQDTDGLTTPEEAAMTWAVAGKKPFFVGKRSIDILSAKDLSRRLVGFTLPEGAPQPEESNLTLLGDAIAGRVTSVAFSPALKTIIGLAYVHPDQSTTGATFDIKLSNGRRTVATAVSTPFYDPENKRQAL